MRRSPWLDCDHLASSGQSIEGSVGDVRQVEYPDDSPTDFAQDHFKEGMAAMKYRPLIGVNSDYRATAKGRVPHCYVHSGYFDCLLSANALPVFIPPLIRESDLTPILDRLDGVMLTGGDDLDPKKMGLTPHPAVTVVPERRELADRLLCKLVQQRRIPVLGIGLGMQELNVCAGGGLFLHLPEDMPKSIPHRDPHGGAHRHIVVMQPGTRLEEIYGPGEIRVNSYHHQGIRKLAPIFRVAALAPDGLIEGFEGKDHSWWVTGVQWHPENEGNISLDMQLIEAFVSAAATSKSMPALAKVG
jgi:putative glutamine amidotransferase